jgi:hypothetical protein
MYREHCAVAASFHVGTEYVTPMEGAARQKMEIVQKFNYLSVPIAHTLSSRA